MTNNFRLMDKARDELVRRFRNHRAASEETSVLPFAPPARPAGAPDPFCRFDRLPAYEKLRVQQAAADRFGLANPFFKVNEGVAGANTIIGGRALINFSSYNYLGLSGHPRVNKAATEAIERYGTSVSASRLVAGERPIQRRLEEEIAALYEVDDCIVFVSGHATNVSTIGCLFGPKDLVVHDGLIHNSVLEGIKISGAARRSFAHNDLAALDTLLAEIRGQFERVLIVVEGLYSMDGDIPDLPALAALKARHRAFLMVDEAHSLGVLGETGHGIREHFGLAGSAADIWMGTLSKALAGCGGFVAGGRALIETLKYSAPGFVYSVGIAPPLAAASLEALRIMRDEPERVARLRRRSGLFRSLCRERGVDCGLSHGYAVVPAILGSSLKAVGASNAMFERGVNVQPILYPAVEERLARLRFFISAQHSEKQLETAVGVLSDLI